MKSVLFALSSLSLMSSSAFAECDLQKLRAEASKHSGTVEDFTFQNMKGKAYPRNVIVSDEFLGSEESPLLVTSYEILFVSDKGVRWSSKAIMIYPVLIHECKLDIENGVDGVTATAVK